MEIASLVRETLAHNAYHLLTPGAYRHFSIDEQRRDKGRTYRLVKIYPIGRLQLELLGRLSSELRRKVGTAGVCLDRDRVWLYILFSPSQLEDGPVFSQEVP
jgi:hypothetical protein